jgi:hypothetical protein
LKLSVSTVGSLHVVESVVVPQPVPQISSRAGTSRWHRT